MTNKIFVPLETGCAPVGGEALFAVKLSPGVYRIDCVPLFVDLHHGDVVQCDESDPDKIPLFRSVLEHSDLVIVHLLLTPKGYRRRFAIEVAVKAAGFYIEKVEGKLYAINADPHRLAELNRLLCDYPECGRWWLDGQEDHPTESK